MKVIYDASAFAVGQDNPEKRAGSHRAVEEVAFGLCRQKACQITFYPGATFRNASAAYQYSLEHHCIKAPILFTGLYGIRKAMDDWRYDSDVINLPAFSYALQNGARHLDLKRRVLRRVGLAGETLLHRSLDLNDWRAIADADIFHSQFAPVPKEVRQFKKPSKVVTIFDVIPLIEPKFFVPETIHLVRSILEDAQPGDWFICISHATKHDLCEYGKVDPARVFVTHLAASSKLFYPCRDAQRLQHIRQKYHIPDGPYLLTLNKLEPRKNTVTVIDAFARLVKEQHLSDLSLVLTGDRGWFDEEIFETAAKYTKLKARIIPTGYVEDADLAPLYSGAIAFVYPSFYEGFGLPPLEAMQCGTPVITSNRSSLPEVVGEAGVMVDPLDVEALCQAVYNLYCDSKYRQLLATRGLRQASKFTWDRCVEQTIAAYCTALAN